MDNAFVYYETHKTELEDDYRYTATTDTCKESSYLPGVFSNTGFTDIAEEAD